MSYQEQIERARALLGSLAERGRDWYEKSGAERLAEHPGVQQGRDWAKTLGFGNRAVQAVGAALVVGTLYVAAAQPFATSAPAAQAVVAERIAPIGTVTLDPSAQSQLADRTDPERSPSAVIN